LCDIKRKETDAELKLNVVALGKIVLEDRLVEINPVLVSLHRHMLWRIDVEVMRVPESAEEL
jgi:hypothetical protein